MSTRIFSAGEDVTSGSNFSNNVVHRNTTVEAKLDELDGEIIEVTDAWNSTKSYSVNDYAIYNNKLYKCILAHSNIVPTNTTYWEETTIGSELTQLSRLLKIENKQFNVPTGIVDATFSAPIYEGYILKGVLGYSVFSKNLTIYGLNVTQEQTVYIYGNNATSSNVGITVALLYVKDK